MRHIWYIHVFASLMFAGFSQQAISGQKEVEACKQILRQQKKQAESDIMVSWAIGQTSAWGMASLSADVDANFKKMERLCESLGQDSEKRRGNIQELRP